MEKIKSQLQHELNNAIRANEVSMDNIVLAFRKNTAYTAENIIETAEILSHFQKLKETYLSVLNKLKGHQ